ncbi:MULTISPECIES: glycosyltransferase [Microbacterium]|uniref:glycosyltransferase n=1 Tax=Microbacterium TaxID=33882 RepID=UPI0022F0D96C|nr:glycosyltransferase [Streptomyces sp. MS2A]
MIRAVTGVWGVVTLFRPDEAPRLFTDLLPQVDGIVAVDDGSGPASDAVLARIAEGGVRVVRLEENSGIGAALNLGIRTAREAGAHAVVTFDQDSTVAPGFVAALHAAAVAAKEAGIPSGPVVPQYFAGVDQAGDPIVDGVVRAAHAIQSGMLIDAETLDRVGLMDAALFIDLVDTDYELRCADAGLPCIVAPGLALPHQLGAQYRISGPLGRRLPVLTLSTPFRYYYRARNRIVLARRYPHHRTRLRRDGLADRAYFVIAALLARPRRAMWRLLRAGARDGRAGRLGRMDAELASAAAGISWHAVRVSQD